MDLKSLSTNIPILSIAASIGLFYNHVKIFFIKIVRVIIKKRELPITFGTYLYFDLIKKGWFIPLDDYKLQDISLFDKNNKVYLPVIHKGNTLEIFLYKYFIPILIRADRERSITFQYLKWTFPFKDFLLKAQLALHEETKKTEKNYSKFRIQYLQGTSLKKLNKSSKLESNFNSEATSNGNKPESEFNEIIVIPPYHHFIRKTNDKFIGIDYESFLWDKTFCSKNKFQQTEIFTKLSNQLESWLKAEEWYNDHNICWKRGIALTGTPGQGRSTLVLELCKKFNLPLFVMDIHSMDNSEYLKCVEVIGNETGVMLFEDIDSVFSGRENLNKSKFGCLNFDCFINSLSGVDAIKKKFIFLTSNFPERLDPALMREGRMDQIIEVKSLNQIEKENLANIILDNKKELVEQVMLDSELDTTAKFEEKCVSLALRSFWNKV